MDEKIDRQIEFLSRYFQGLGKLMSKARKNGLDTRIAELRMMNIPHKLKYLEISKSKKDIRKLKILLAKAEREIPRK